MFRRLALLFAAWPLAAVAAEPAARPDPYGVPLPPGAVARVGTETLRREQPAEALAFSADGELLAAADPAGHTVWEVRSRKRLHAFRPDKGLEHVVSVAFSPDKKRLVLGSRAFNGQHTWRLFEVETGRDCTPPGGPLGAAAYSPDGKLLATSGQDAKGLQLWDAQADKPLRRLEGQTEGVVEARFADNGTVVVRDWNGGLTWHDLATGKALRRWQGYGGATARFALSPDGRRVVWPAGEETYNLLDAATQKEVRRPKNEEGAFLDFAPDGRLVASGSWERVGLYEPATGKRVNELPLGRPHGRVAAAFAPDGKTLAVALGPRVVLWDLTADAARRAGWHDSPVTFVAFAEGGRLVTGAQGWHEPVCVWDGPSGRLLHQFPVRGLPHGAALLPDGRGVVVPGDNGPRVLDVVTGKERTGGARPQRPTRLVFAPDGTKVTVAERGLPAVDPSAGEGRRIGVPSDYVSLSPDGRWAATVNSVESPFQTNVPQFVPGDHLRLWDLESGRPVWANREAPQRLDLLGTSGAVWVIGWTPDARLLLWHRNDGALHLLDTRTLTERTVLRVAGLRGGGVCSPDGRTLAVRGPEGALRLIDLHTGGERLRLDTGQRGVAGLAFSGDGRLLATGGTDTTALVWDVNALAGAKPAGEKDWPALWDDLSGAEAGSFRAVRSLAVSPGATAWLEGRLRSYVHPVTPERIAGLIADLDDEDFAVRQRATEGLRRLRGEARPALLKAKEARPPLETLRRLEDLLEDPDLMTPSAETLRAERGVEALETAGTPEAREALARLAGEAKDERVRREAEEATRRNQPEARARE